MVRAVNATGIGAASAEASATTPGPEYTFAHDQDIGAPPQAGSLALRGGQRVYTVQGGGVDIWGTSDSFHFDYSSLSGNGSIVAEVTSVEYTSPLAKAGVMFRDSTNRQCGHGHARRDAGRRTLFRDPHERWRRDHRPVRPASPRLSGSSFPARETSYGLLFHVHGGFPGHELDPVGSPVTLSSFSTTADVGLAVTAHTIGLEHEHVLWRECVLEQFRQPRADVRHPGVQASSAPLVMTQNLSIVPPAGTTLDDLRRHQRGLARHGALAGRAGHAGPGRHEQL